MADKIVLTRNPDGSYRTDAPLAQLAKVIDSDDFQAAAERAARLRNGLGLLFRADYPGEGYPLQNRDGHPVPVYNAPGASITASDGKGKLIWHAGQLVLAAMIS